MQHQNQTICLSPYSPNKSSEYCSYNLYAYLTLVVSYYAVMSILTVLPSDYNGTLIRWTISIDNDLFAIDWTRLRNVNKSQVIFGENAAAALPASFRGILGIHFSPKYLYIKESTKVWTPPILRQSISLYTVSCCNLFQATGSACLTPWRFIPS